MQPQIINLTSRPQAIPQLAGWHHAQWSDLNPGRSLEQRIANMENYLSIALLPSMFISVSDEQVLGSAAIVTNDMDTHQELTPWLASVYVDLPYRHQGIASSLVRHVMQQAKAEAIPALYLFTPGQEALYAKLGWEVVSRENYRGAAVTLMQVHL